VLEGADVSIARKDEPMTLPAPRQRHGLLPDFDELIDAVFPYGCPPGPTSRM
jgi:hypothetical protein